jgi:ribosomal protein S21
MMRKQEEEYFKPYLVTLIDGKSQQDLELALRKFKRLVKEGLVLQDHIKHMEFKRRGQEAHEKRMLGAKRQRFELARAA